MYSGYALSVSGGVLIMAEQRMCRRPSAALCPFVNQDVDVLCDAVNLDNSDRKQGRFDSSSDLSKVNTRRIVLESTNPSQHPYRPL